MAEPWYDYPVTHGYITSYEGPNTDTPHYAEDLGTPFHTSLTAPTSGVVKVADYQGWGGEIFVQPDDKSLPEWYMYHPDEVDVHVGQHVNAGQFIGLSGGENPGYPGAEHPALPEWSSGPHTHVGWFTKWQSTPIGTRPYGPPPDNLISMAKGGGGQSSNVPSGIYTAVEPFAQTGGVPDPLWETIADVESGFNPNATHLENTGYWSVGLFQLEQGIGQGAGHTVSQLEDPATNAQLAMPAISKAWKDLGPSFDDSMQWWEKFAAESGHPGGAPGNAATVNEAAKLMNTYGQFGGSPGNPGNNNAPGAPSPCQAPQGLNNLNPGAWADYATCLAQNAASNATQAAAGSIMGWIGGTIGPFLMRVGVGVVGIAMVWAGLNEITAALKGESGGELIEDNEEKAKEAAAPNKEKKPTHEGEKKQKKESSEKKPEKKAEPKEAPKSEAPEASASEGAGAGEAGAAAGGGADAAALAAV